MVPRDALVDWLNSIRCPSPAAITPEAKALIEKHIALYRPVLRTLMDRHGVDIDQAECIACTPAHDTTEYASLLDDLFSRVRFEGAGEARYALIANVAACYCWHLDPELSEMPNPWEPLLSLYEMGYLPTVGPDGDGTCVSLSVRFGDGFAEYQVI
jgi:hypothetical protein